MLALDDAHWFDAASLRFVLYLARRIADLPVAMIVATREDERGPEPQLVQQLTVEPDAEILRPAPFSLGGVAAVLAERMAQPVAPEFGAACHAAVRGNPFLLSELSGALVSDGVSPTAGLRRRCTTCAREPWRATILLRLGRMPAGTTELATAIAVLGDGASLELARTLAGQDRRAAGEALDRLAEAQILMAAPQLDFVHPIVREAVYGELGPAEREDWHARAAQLVGERGESIERVALHLLATSPGGRPGTVEALRRAARGALDRGASDIAALYLRRALAEPPPSAERPGVLLELGRAGLLAGEPLHEVEAPVREAIGLIGEPAARTQAWRLLSRVKTMDGGAGGVAVVLEQALEDVGAFDPEERERLETELDNFGLTRPEHIARAAARIDALPAPAGRTAAERRTLCNLVLRSCFAGRCAERTARLAEQSFANGKLIADEGANNTVLYQVSYALALADRLDTAERMLDLAMADGRAHGSVYAIGVARGSRSYIHYVKGAIADAEADVCLALEFPALQPFLGAYLCLALTERGALDEADRAATSAGCGPELPESLHVNKLFWARGRLRAAQGRLPEALDDLLEFGRRSERVDMRNPTIHWRADAALLQARLGDRAAAEALASEYDELAGAWGTARVIGISARTRGLLASGDDGVALLREAVEAHEASPARLEHARSLLELGAALRRAGLRAEARERLGAAGELALRCGATMLAQRAAAELGVAGAAGRQHAFSGLDALTPSELRVARMAAEGMSNREIAESLYVTAKTIENQLGRVYQKLGIGSRTVLARTLAR